MSALLSPLTLGDLELKNRVILAPLTRSRATEKDRVPTALMRDYYVQRATAGLILTEATAVSAQGVGYAATPGIWSNDQVKGWRMITDAVHEAGGLIFLQLWHVGRISHPSFLNGDAPVAPSAIKPAGHVSLVRPKAEYPTPRALDISEISGIVEDYKRGAQNAKDAGFDGVEIHSANGYLIDQFLQDSTNHRTDRYGGSIENRARFLMEITDAVLTIWDKKRVGVHLAPRMDSHDMGDSDPKALFGYVAKELGKRDIGFICTREHQADDSISDHIKEQFGGVFIANEAFTKDSAEKALSENKADAVAFGKLYIANPDLPKRFALNAPLNTPDPNTFYGGGEKGYTDYPSLEE